MLCLERRKTGILYHSRCATICETIASACSQSSRMLKLGKWGPVPNRLRSLLKTRSKYYIRWRTEFSGQNNDSNNNSKKTQNNSTVSMVSRIAASASVRAVGRVRKIRALRAPVTLTPLAVERVKGLLENQTDCLGLRVSVRERGCNGLSYTLEYTNEKKKFDEEVNQDGVRLFICSKAQLTLLGTEMDYVEDKLSSGFVFNNPNIKGTCGCGESFHV